MTSNSPLSSGTRAIMLLCGHFGPKRSSVKPLTPTEYHRFVRWLAARRLSLTKVLDPDADEILRGYRDKEVASQRLIDLLGRASGLAQALDKWTRTGIWVMSEADPDYPGRLRRRLKAAGSPLLFGAGPRHLLDEGGVCIVGSRDSTEAGLEFARTLGTRCGRDRLHVISSDMRGVDREAITASLAAGGRVVSVVTDSLEKAVSTRRNRNALASGALVLLTPFAPDTRFSVSNAMRANKYQYTLSDVAIIVETRRHGGVWSGADENRNEGWVPAFVRVGDRMSPGNTALLHLGLLPITEDDVRSRDDLKSFLAYGNAYDMPDIDQPTVVGDGTAATRPVDLYALFLAALLSFVSHQPRTEADIARHFGIERSQARKWLARALSENRIARSGKPVRYQALD